MLEWIRAFEDGEARMKDLLGGKGAHLAEMTRAGFPVPHGFTITTQVCRAYYNQGEKLPDGLIEPLREAVKRLEQQRGCAFGEYERPLFVSVRSGAVTSMPGMMDTILNVGMNDETVRAAADASGDERFAYDCY